ncbi:MAG: hypothetical protein H7839_24330 [Magnetococcus sp. YQC-5]
MKTVIWVIGLLVAIAAICAFLAGCSEVYLPPDVQIALDQRITELQVDIEGADAACKPLLESDLDFLLTLQGGAE